MKRLLVTVALTLVAGSASAAIQYEFTQKNSTGDAVEPINDVTARAFVDGERSRVDFIGGNLYPPGTYVVSTDGSRRLVFVDPEKEWFTEVNTVALATSLGSSAIKITNLKSSDEQLDDTPIIAGQQTTHTRVTMTYDIGITINTIPLKQHVRTEIDTWSTLQFPASNAGSFLSGMRTGNPDLDRLLETETNNTKGFPMRQTVTTHTIADLPPSRSELQSPTQKTIVRDMWVTSIREAASDASKFVIPAKYRRADVKDVPKATKSTLDFNDPPTK